MKEDVVGDVGQLLWILLGTVSFVLLIAVANVANLFLVRAEGRQREMAVRTAMGAGRGDLIRAYLTESTVLSLVVMALRLFIVHLRVRPDVVITTGAAPGYFALRFGRWLRRTGHRQASASALCCGWQRRSGRHQLSCCPR